MFVLVCPSVCVIPVTTVAVIDYTDLLPMKITLQWVFFGVRSVNFLKTLNYLRQACLEVTMKQFTK